MTCLYTQDPTSGHSTRIGTALDGRGIYGKYVNGSVLPTDLDACNGRYGVTPDSGGQTVYYYVVNDRPPFVLGCFGPGTMAQCKALYKGCSEAPTRLTNASGSFDYALYCPCYDNSGQNTAANWGPAGSTTGSPVSTTTSRPSTQPSLAPTQPSLAPTRQPTFEGETWQPSAAPTSARPSAAQPTVQPTASRSSPSAAPSAATDGTSSPVPVAAIAGGAGGLVLLVVAVAAAVVVGRRKAQRRGYALGLNDATRELTPAKPPPAASAVDDII
jgi:hypothetical protein